MVQHQEEAHCHGGEQCAFLPLPLHDFLYSCTCSRSGAGVRSQSRQKNSDPGLKVGMKGTHDALGTDTGAVVCEDAPSVMRSTADFLPPFSNFSRRDIIIVLREL